MLGSIQTGFELWIRIAPPREVVGRNWRSIVLAAGLRGAATSYNKQCEAVLRLATGGLSPPLALGHRTIRKDFSGVRSSSSPPNIRPTCPSKVIPSASQLKTLIVPGCHYHQIRTPTDSASNSSSRFLELKFSICEPPDDTSPDIAPPDPTRRPRYHRPSIPGTSCTQLLAAASRKQHGTGKYHHTTRVIFLACRRKIS